jgi:hypothetical protein
MENEPLNIYDNPANEERLAANAKRRRRRWRIFFVCLGLIILYPFVRYRLSFSSPVTFQDRVSYLVLDFKQLSVRSLCFENLFGNRIVNLEDGTGIYVSAEDFRRCWPDDIQEKMYSTRATIEVRPLLFGGYGLGRVIAVEKINEPPRLRK